MSESLNLDHLERQAWRRDASDGLMEFLAGILFFFVARAMVDPHLAWVPALLLFPMRWANRFFKERFTWPRIGYVKLKSEDSKDFGRGVLTYLAVVFVIYLALLWVFGDITSFQSWRQWLPTLMGGFCSGGFFFAAGKSRLARHYALAIFCIAWGLVCSLPAEPFSTPGIQRWALGLGLVNLLTGVAVFVRFVRRYPVREAEAGDE